MKKTNLDILSLFKKGETLVDFWTLRQRAQTMHTVTDFHNARLEGVREGTIREMDNGHVIERLFV